MDSQLAWVLFGGADPIYILGAVIICLSIFNHRNLLRHTAHETQKMHGLFTLTNHGELMTIQFSGWMGILCTIFEKVMHKKRVLVEVKHERNIREISFLTISTTMHNVLNKLIFSLLLIDSAGWEKRFLFQTRITETSCLRTTKQ